MLKLVFMGTPDFAVHTLNALHAAGYEIAAAVSQPDKPKGRHAELVPTPVKARALELGIPVLQPEKAGDAAFMEEMKRIAPDVIVVAAYGKLLKKELLELPRFGCINVHASLLPRWRGAAPIQWAVIEGDETSGITTMQMDAGLDTGDILLQKSLRLSGEETGGSLFDRLAVLGGELIVETLKLLEAGELSRTPQPAEGMTYAKMLTKDLGELCWDKDAAVLERLIRGLSPWPGTYTWSEGKLLKIHRAALVKGADAARTGAASAGPNAGALEAGTGGTKPGTVILKDQKLLVCCGTGALEILELQPEGKKRMSAGDYLRGYHPQFFGR